MPVPSVAHPLPSMTLVYDGLLNVCLTYRWQNSDTISHDAQSGQIKHHLQNCRTLLPSQLWRNATKRLKRFGDSPIIFAWDATLPGELQTVSSAGMLFLHLMPLKPWRLADLHPQTLGHFPSNLTLPHPGNMLLSRYQSNV